MLRRSWNALLDFLKIIGLVEERTVEREAQLASFKLYHAEFRKLLSANNSFLENMGDLEHKLFNQGAYDLFFLKRNAARLVSDVHLMVDSMNVISDRRFPGLEPAYDRVTTRLILALGEVNSPQDEHLTLDLPEIFRNHADLVGGKMANLGEIHNAVGLPAPDGFAVTAQACRLVFAENDLASFIERKHNARLSAEEIPEMSRRLQECISSAELPLPLARSILDAHDRLIARRGANPGLAVRSSAIGEDSNLSFAGQFLSVLNIEREALLDAYLKVLASLFSPEAVHYRAMHNLTGGSAAMGVGCILMVNAIASGVIFSTDPRRPDAKQIVIHAVRGLGVTLADGSSFPEEIVFSRDHEPRPLSRIPSSQTVQQICRHGPGVVEVSVPDESVGLPILSDADARVLACWALKLESHFGGPQDIEWAMDQDHKLIVLQSRPLRMTAGVTRTEKAIEGRQLLLHGGETACPGVGSGPAVHLSEDDNFETFPQGGVLIARRSSPKFIRLMAKANAIVTDAGSTTGHMASLTREFRVPTLLNTKTATRTILPGALITVDATNGFVYAGYIPELGQHAGRTLAAPSMQHQASALPLPSAVAKVADLIIPLNLSDPRSPDFIVERCNTLHDLARFIHEKSYEQMFHMGESLGDFRSASYHLDVFLPIDLYIIDLGGGIISSQRGRKVKRKDITSVPLAALLKGMLHRKIPRFGPRSFDIGGFLELVMRHATTGPEEERTFRDPCYALVSSVYLNYTARVGYHFGVVDSYCGQTANKNYINLLFRGGGAETVRRTRRAKAIATILGEVGFSVEANRDLVTARISKTTTKETEERLEKIGQLMQFMRQMDLAMVSDEFADKVVQAFLKGDFGLEQFGK